VHVIILLDAICILLDARREPTMTLRVLTSCIALVARTVDTHVQEEMDQMAELKYGADAVFSLIKPVSVTMIIVIATIRSVQGYANKNANAQQLA
jgi:hypothetical protein